MSELTTYLLHVRRWASDAIDVLQNHPPNSPARWEVYKRIMPIDVGQVDRVIGETRQRSDAAIVVPYVARIVELVPLAALRGLEHPPATIWP